MKSDKAQIKAENLEELISATKAFEPNDEENMSSLASFLSHATLEAGDNQSDPDQPQVQLMTLHSAKGLEFPVVFLTGVEEGLFPHQMSMEDPNGLEEERRLCYVGMTRAMKKLYMTHAECRRLHGHETIQRPSRFIREIPKQHLQSLGKKVKVREPFIFKARSTQKEANGFQLGQTVFHKTFGEGTIIHVEGYGPRARVQVKFKKVGTKWLVLEFANLEAV